MTAHLERPVALADIAALTASDVRAFMAARRSAGIGSRSLRRSLSAARNFTGFLRRRNVAVSDAFDTLTPPAPKKGFPRPLRENDALALIELAYEGRPDWTGKRDAALLCLLYGCGLRISEALGLAHHDWPRAAADGLRIAGKGGHMRDVPLLPVVHNAVAEYLAAAPFDFADDAALFRGVRGGRLSARAVQMRVADLRRRLDLPDSVTPHALRHSFASHLLAHGGDLRTIQELLGHKRLASTQIYTDIDTRHLRDVYAAAHPRAKTR